MDNAQTDKLVEALARALAQADGIEVCSDASYRHSSYGIRARACIPVIQSLSAHPAGDVALHRYRHNKRGTEYDLICVAKLQDATGKGVNEGAHLCVYRGDDGYHWAREVGEFIDGRFTRIPFLATPAAPTTDASGEPVAWIRPNWNDPATFDGMSPVSTYYTNGWLPLYLAQPDVAAPTDAGALVEELRTKLRMVISHASGGYLSEPNDVDRSINDICVQISANNNRIWQHAQEVALRASTGTPAEGEVLDPEEFFATAIDDSLDMDWTGTVGAKAILRRMEEQGLVLCAR